MNKPLSVLKVLERQISDAKLYKDFLVIGNSQDYVLRGVIFERTLVKGEYYVWAVIMPMYMNLGGVTLSYSSRLADSRVFSLKDHSVDMIADQVLGCLKREQWLDKFQRISTPRELLDQIKTRLIIPRASQRTVLIEIAILSFLSGDLAGCATAARDCVELPALYDWEDRFIADARYILTALERDHDELRRWIDTLHQQSRAALLYRQDAPSPSP